MEQVLVGMSGGVDSSVAALILMERYQVSGGTMKLFDSGDIVTAGKTCCAITDVEDARRVCHRLGLDHHVFNFTGEFYKEVMERFAASYASGETPNPCIDCNRFVKFPGLLRRGTQLGFPYVATGHYAQIRWDAPTGRWQLRRAVDAGKDQSYVLYTMTQEELGRTLLPLGERTKADIRAMAEAEGLVTADKPDSQDICFVPDGDYGTFLTEKMGITTNPGDILDKVGQVLGKHTGAVRYTIGQRRGLGVAAPTPLYVIGKDMAQNTVIVGEQADLMRDRFYVRDANWISIPALTTPCTVTVMTRYRDREETATLHPCPDGQVEVRLETPKRAVTPGQAAVFYQGDVVVGGGVIC
ncbi:MAG: tRNA 2-thiouridine(34) synthase MnmA [Oscillospiraceae bacterium]|nr:tRNA 2-thiouridine(34) synthase MnmA [Oscillospiraceae bacterium]